MINVPGILTALSATDEAPRVEIKLVPIGVTKCNDGREIELDAKGVASAKAMFKAHGTPLPIDYEHETLGGHKALAAGFIHELVERGDGLYGQVEWNAEARQEIKSGQYRYLSPVLLHAAKGDRRVIGIHSAGLTNKPALPHMSRLAAKEEDPTPIKKEKSAMDELLKQLAAQMGMAEGASGEDVIKAVIAKMGAMKQTEAVASSMKSSLGLRIDASDSEVTARLLAMKEDVGKLAALRSEIDTLKAEKSGATATALVERFVKENKINPHNEKLVTACREWAGRDAKGFEAHYSMADAIVPSGETKLPAKESVPAAGDEDAMLATALKENNNNHKTALVSLQSKLMGEITAKGFTTKAARETCEKKYPKIFGTAE